MGAIVVELSGAPEGKGRPRFRAFKAGSRVIASAYTPAKTRKYEDALRFAAQEVMGERAPLEGALSVHVVATFPIPQSYSKRKQHDALCGVLRPAKKPDADNLLKVLDSCNQVVFRDDSQIVDASISKVYGARPSLRIEVREIAQPGPSLADPPFAVAP